MYQPLHFTENRIEVQHALIRAFPLGALITSGPSGLTADHIPFLVDEQEPFGKLRAHVARANPVWRETDPDGDVLVIFQERDQYITPS
jgi:transcriptional regulator